MASGNVRRWQQIIQELILIAGTSLSTYFVVRFLLSRLEFDPESQKHEDAKRKSAAILRRLDRGDDSDDSSSSRQKRPQKQKKQDLVLTQYEQAIAMDVVAPEDIPVSFNDIEGLDDIIEELKES
uniref:Uncharacterized protein n=1 Tax=Coccidioides posadasii RMSCC 3488 TaxID=454284 RepID=A0A0J6F6R6_COCPO|nr:hypothetical protein CPAG_04947 [Coccidioides posadasii RMSCC 3488]